MPDQDTTLKLAIADRAVATLAAMGLAATKLECHMDIEYVNEICPLRLRELLDADEPNFEHDIVGIYLYFSHVSKQLQGPWTPRFAA